MPPDKIDSGSQHLVERPFYGPPDPSKDPDHQLFRMENGFPSSFMGQPCFPDQEGVDPSNHPMGPFQPQMVEPPPRQVAQVAPMQTAQQPVPILSSLGEFYNPSPVTLPPPRERFNYLPYHTEVLNGIYDVYKYPNREQRQVIAQRLIIKAQQVRVWFQNRRRKDVVAKANSQTPKANGDSVKYGRRAEEGVIKAIVAELANYERETDEKAIARAKVRSAQGMEKNSEATTSAEPDEPAVPELDEDHQGAKSMDPSPELNPSEESASTSVRSSNSSDSTDNPSPPAIIPTNEQLDMVAPPNTTVAIAPYLEAESDSPSTDTNTNDLQEDLSTSQDSADSHDFPPPNKVAPVGGSALSLDTTNNPSASPQSMILPTPGPSVAFQQFFSGAASHSGFAPASDSIATASQQEMGVSGAPAFAGPSNMVCHIMGNRGYWVPVYGNAGFNTSNPCEHSGIHPFHIIADAPRLLASHSQPHNNQLQPQSFNITSYPNPHFNNYPNAD